MMLSYRDKRCDLQTVAAMTAVMNTALTLKLAVPAAYLRPCDACQ